MNNISVNELPLNDLHFYAASISCIIPSNELIQKVFVNNFFDLCISPFYPLKENLKKMENFSLRELTIFKPISEIANRMFSFLKSGCKKEANRSYDEFTAALLEMHDKLSPDLEGFTGTDLIIISPEQAGIVKNGITSCEFAIVNLLYKKIKGKNSSLKIRDSKKHPGFREEVLRNFRILLSRDSGRELLEYYTKLNGGNIEIKYSKVSGFCERRRVIKFDINDQDFEVFNENGSRVSLFPLNFVTLFHELIHAKRFIDGSVIDEPSFDPAFFDHEEEITITGESIFGEEPLCENRLLAEFELPIRSSCVGIDPEDEINDVFSNAVDESLDGDVDRILETNLVSENSLILGLEKASQKGNEKIKKSIQNSLVKRGFKIYKEPLISPLIILANLSSANRKIKVAKVKGSKKAIASKFSKYALTGSEVDVLLNRHA